MQIKAVTFDVGGTLIEPWPSVGHVYCEIANRHGIGGFTAELLNARFNAAWRVHKNFNDTRAGWEELVNEVFQGLVSPGICAEFFPELYDRFAQSEAWRIFDDVTPTLEMLASRGIRLGVISNWDERLRILLRRLLLDHHFETIVISCEIGSGKPSPIIFEKAAAKFGLPPGAILHVGDSFESDIAGARAAGFHARRIYRSAGEARKGDLHSLRELAEKVAGGD